MYMCNRISLIQSGVEKMIFSDCPAWGKHGTLMQRLLQVQLVWGACAIMCLSGLVKWQGKVLIASSQDTSVLMA